MTQIYEASMEQKYRLLHHASILQGFPLEPILTDRCGLWVHLFRVVSSIRMHQVNQQVM